MTARLSRRALIAGSLCACSTLAVPAAAQDGGQVRSPVLVIDSDRMYLESAFGRRITAEIEADSAQLGSENRSIEAELTAEEAELTELRSQTPADEFRKLADAFDLKVRTIRREQDAKVRALGLKQDSSRGAFLNAAAPVLETMMREAGAAVVLERRTAFVSLNAVDITDAAIARIDAQIGDGADLNLQRPVQNTQKPDTPRQP